MAALEHRRAHGANVEADAEFDPFVRRYTGIALGHATLNVDGAAHGIDHTLTNSTSTPSPVVLTIRPRC